MIEEELKSVVEALSVIKEDSQASKSIKAKIDKIITELQGDDELSIKINRISSELDELADDTSLQPFIRTQIWNVASLLETV